MDYLLLLSWGFLLLALGSVLKDIRVNKLGKEDINLILIGFVLGLMFTMVITLYTIYIIG